MGTTSETASDQSDERGTLQRAVAGDQAAWAQVLAPHRKRLRRMVALRLAQRLRGRIDPSDVLQEAFLQAAQAGPMYLERPEQPVFLWLRWLTGMTLQLMHRRHLGVQARDAGREVQLLDRPWPEASSSAQPANSPLMSSAPGLRGGRRGDGRAVPLTDCRPPGTRAAR
jgi:RNA polymerase sigma-70 factor, ECF subfamily